MAERSEQGMITLIDDGSQPTLRQHIGALLSSCALADIAVGHIRLAAIDLSDAETRRIRRARILLGRLEVRALTDLGAEDGGAAERLGVLLRFLESGRVHVRSAGIGAWAPDFSIYRGSRAGAACLIGSHWFREPVAPAGGPTFTTLLTDPVAVSRALDRFDALWRRGHDVLEPVLSAITLRRSFDAA